ncbi:MAG: hypothetical protein E6772_13890 [Dysgonomonas sp.]|nr:hypothetical protein [Dysgonomonas sp.]
MNYNLQIQKILLAVDNAANILDKIKLQKQAVSIADSHNDLDWGYELRGDLMYLEKGTSQCIESIPAFTWMLDVVDNNPDLFDESEILSKYRWMIVAVGRNADFTLDQIHNIREDYRRRMYKNGHGVYTFYNEMFRWFLETGNADLARKHQELRDKEQPDTISYCEACSVNLDVEIELLAGNFDKAITLADDLLTERVTCYYEPFSVLSKLVYYLLKRRDKRAEIYYQKAEEALSQQESGESYSLQSISYLIFYNALFNPDRGWELFERYSVWDINAEDYSSFYFSVNLLPLFRRKEERSLSLNPELSYFKEDNMYNSEELYLYYREKAKELADKFDKRNGNSYFTDTFNNIESF